MVEVLAQSYDSDRKWPRLMWDLVYPKIREAKFVMKTIRNSISALSVGLLAAFITPTPSYAGDYNGNFMARIGATVVDPDTDFDVFTPAPVPGSPAEVSTEVIPSLTLTYFFNQNLALELFCCFAKHEAKGKGALAALPDLGDTWIFPPALTLQYHFNNMGGIKPYVGAGVQYINFFNEGSASSLAGAKLDIDDAFGFTLQAGVDVPLGDGWYLNGDVKKTWLETDAKWSNGVTADFDLDPWIFTVGVGYRFNLSDLVGGN